MGENGLYKDGSVLIEKNEAKVWNKISEKTIHKRLAGLSCDFMEAAENKSIQLDEDDRIKLRLLANVASMRLTPGSANEPFSPLSQRPDGSHTALPHNFSAQDLDLLLELVGDVEFCLLKARIYDLLWFRLKPKQPEHAKAAIGCYISLGINPETWDLDGRSEFEQAYRLARKIKSIEQQDSIEGMICAEIDKYIKGDLAVSFSVLSLIDELNLLKGEDGASKCEAIGNKLVAERNFQGASRLFLLASKRYRDDRSKYIAMLVRVAECYASEAQSLFESESGSKLMSGSMFSKAIQAYRTIPNEFREQYGVQVLISKLRHKLNSAGKNVVNNMVPIRTRIENSNDLKEIARAHVSGKATEYEALCCFTSEIFGPTFKKCKSSNEQCKGSGFFGLFVGAEQYSDDGRVIAKSPDLISAWEDGGDKYDAVMHEKMVRSFNEEMNLYVQNYIIPALHKILDEHSFSKLFVYEVCRLSPLISSDSINLVSQAIWLGFEYNFHIAIHIVAPQIEKIVRILLKKEGAHTTTHKDGIDHENSLSSLLDLKEAKTVLGEDFVFELKAVFTDSVGPNLRNEVAHGLLTDGGAFSFAPVYGWWLLLRIIMHSINKPKDSDNH